MALQYVNTTVTPAVGQSTFGRSGYSRQTKMRSNCLQGTVGISTFDWSIYLYVSTVTGNNESQQKSCRLTPLARVAFHPKSYRGQPRQCTTFKSEINADLVVHCCCFATESKTACDTDRRNASIFSNCTRDLYQ